MSTLLEHQIRHENYDYRFTVRFDDLAIMADIARLEVKSERKSISGGDWESLTLKFEYRPKDEEISVYCDGRPIGVISTTRIPEKSIENIEDDDANTDPKREVENFEKFLDESDDGNIAAEISEAILQHFPTDPIIGCLIKGVASTVLGQLIRCWYPRRDTRPLREMLAAIGGCLDGNKLKMLKTFVWRSGWCMARCGV